MGLKDPFTPTAEVQRLILDELGSKIVANGEFQGDFWIQLEAHHLRNVVEFLRGHEALRFDSFVDLCGVDYLPRKPRFEVVTHLYSLEKKHRIRIRCLVHDGPLTVPSLTTYWKAADWQEREAYDNYGILFEGHPRLARILSAPGVTHHAQRKDFPLKGEREETEDL